ncbi:UNKNOWN [Stylonychia lemnae]|uniref:Uncharacterized protein n=1 Tax=Stylonychia lemnae TaxID=5949 RepID=A0A078B6S8_STYLE|nr:UNKNOWN [Stylonychia lemnae]|eukprot:CDW88997.1 UNKNOWN [Stylonychia lemnae]
MLGWSNLTYYSINDDQYQLTDFNFTQSLISCQILLDDVILTTKIERYTLLDALTNTGGLIGILTIIVKIFVQKIQELIFYQSMVRDLFFVQEDQISKTSSQVLLWLINKRSEKKEQSRLLFECAIKQVDKQFEVLQILKNQQLTSFLVKVALAKYQRKLVPYFKQNLIRKQERNNDNCVTAKIQSFVNSPIISKNEKEETYWKLLNKNDKIKRKLYVAKLRRLFLRA